MEFCFQEAAVTGSFVSPLDGTDTKLQREEAIEWLFGEAGNT